MQRFIQFSRGVRDSTQRLLKYDEKCPAQPFKLFILISILPKQRNTSRIDQPSRRYGTACRCNGLSTYAGLGSPRVATVAGVRTCTVRSTAAIMTGNPWRRGRVREYNAPESVLGEISRLSLPQLNVPGMGDLCRNIGSADVLPLSGNAYVWPTLKLMLHMVGWQT